MITENQNTVTKIKNSYLDKTIDSLNFSTFAILFTFSFIQYFDVSLEKNLLVVTLLSIGLFLITSKTFTSNFENDISGLLPDNSYFLIYKTSVDFLIMLNIVFICVVLAIAYITKILIMPFDSLVEAFPFSSIVITCYFCAAFIIYFHVFKKLLNSAHCTLNDFIRG